jgi:hypothetical protein
MEEGALRQLRIYYDMELTYTSNAIEGNTLTYRETAEVIEHGVTVGGKKLKDHVEALDHYEAVQWTREQAARGTPVGENTVCELHRRIAGSPVVFPNPLKTPELMAAFGRELETMAPTPQATFDAHFRLTARLLMNLLLIRGGYPPLAVRPEDRMRYLDALEVGSLTEDLGAFVLVDLTHDNSGAYWEAGYAEGLGKPVIYICEQTKFDSAKTLFDTNHSTTIMWSASSPRVFSESLVATLRRSLNLFAGDARNGDLI